MKHLLAYAAVLLLAASTAVAADGENAVRVTPVIASSLTATGQPIVLPRDNARVVVSIFDIAQGATLPEHKHPFPRYAYVLAGTLSVTNTETGRTQIYKTGEFIVEAIDQWHRGTSLENAPVKLLVIDQIAGDQSNTVMRD
jgi:quercetin dioxygenase-like cupin family protein